jgi:hypothetical protein
MCVPDHNGTGRLSDDANTPVFLRAWDGAELLGLHDFRVIGVRVKPDAWQRDSGELVPLYLESTLRHAARPGGSLHRANVRRGRPRKGQEPRPVPGPERVLVVRRGQVEVAS